MRQGGWEGGIEGGEGGREGGIEGAEGGREGGIEGGERGGVEGRMGGGVHVKGEGSCLWGWGSEEEKYWEHFQLGEKCVLDSDELYTKSIQMFCVHV